MRSPTRRLLTGVALVSPCVIAAMFSACASAAINSTSDGIEWRVENLITEETTVTVAGYTGRADALIWRYHIVLIETKGIGVTFNRIDTRMSW